MAIKVSGTTVIDDSRNISNVGIISATTINATTITGDGSNLSGVSVDPFFVIPTRTGIAVTFYAGDNQITIGTRSGDVIFTV